MGYYTSVKVWILILEDHARTMPFMAFGLAFVSSGAIYFRIYIKLCIFSTTRVFISDCIFKMVDITFWFDKGCGSKNVNNNVLRIMQARRLKDRRLKYETTNQ